MKKTVPGLMLARGLTVLVMPAVHTVMWYGHPEVHQSWAGYLLRFFAEGPGAQLFMLIMGFLMAIGTRQTRRYYFYKGGRLLLAGYGLNFFRIYLPACLGLLPPALIESYQPGQPASSWPFLLIGDILQFAGISCCIIGLLVHLKGNSFRLIVGACYLTVAIASPFVWGLRSANPVADHWLALLCAADHRAFFPVFPWLCYPLAGLYFGSAYRHALSSTAYYRQLLKAGLLLLFAGLLLDYGAPATWDIDFYRSGPGRTICYTGFSVCWIWLMQQWFVKAGPDQPVFRLLRFCNRHITAIYWIHWIILGWSMPFFGFQQLKVPACLAACLLISLVTGSMVWLYTKTRKPVWFRRVRYPSSNKSIL